MRAILNKTRISPIKARVIAQVIRGKMVQESLDVLALMPKKAAKIFYKVLKSAAYNAKNNFGQDLKSLCVSSVQVNEGGVYKRGVPRSRGRVNPIRKPTSNIRIELVAKTPIKKTTPQATPKIIKKSTKKDINS
ncbi:MAG: 50S ribosomal protein L22, large subunit ribosomal protein L22 [Candidatus Peregrinibacteria bacterium GW2011_GWF2_33_10]|nr:MAG: 50S ribosomal protein L22, large subunit ribosomal protein L22 [Candidatus Peregrinibacteria bacterium GW2011_GWF2_33_10]OGJ46132.1 MAG: 50S ribosomal protein L22 [Candidatus Peregrinibacteria bacterium RIFOXYA12_FULL_33_12]OGJ46162.1 MAG: 50S ribosomal protein L22 [Candidatus Peregrinibacteria bacterium RIFOXYA2_FULL_33_21]OGJ51579.1 MAG: 50S ribosomal protein L22 [Candidatus Peregrinibacteria bacterium RIFOXYB2_FULL_33_20]